MLQIYLVIRTIAKACLYCVSYPVYVYLILHAYFLVCYIYAYVRTYSTQIYVTRSFKSVVSEVWKSLDFYEAFSTIMELLKPVEKDIFLQRVISLTRCYFSGWHLLFGDCNWKRSTTPGLVSCSWHYSRHFLGLIHIPNSEQYQQLQYLIQQPLG